MHFRDRYDAALQLIPHLEKYRNERGIVLAVPRGGVPIAYYIAKQFHFPLELLLSKKIGHPQNPELAIGAVSPEDHLIDPRYDVPGEYIEQEIIRIRENLGERYKKFAGDRKPLDIQGRTVIIVDDGVATGLTLMASIQLIKKKGPKKIIAAIPVAPPGTAQRLAGMVDELVCLYAPEEFYGVGQFYDDFSEVSDEEVKRMLDETYRVNNAA